MPAKFKLFGNLFGKGKTVMGDMVGGSVHIAGRRIIVDGKVITDSAEGGIELTIIEGVIENVTSDMTVNCGPVTGNVDAGMSVNCGNVGGDVTSEMSINCGDIAGDAKADMSITAKTIKGKAKAGMSIHHG